MSTQRSQRKQVQVIFNPLIVSCKLTVISNTVPAAQEYDTFTQEFVPDRTVTPTKILPILNAINPDGVMYSRSVNRLLSTDATKLLWTVNNKPISQVWDEGTDYTVETGDTDLRGMLSVSRNIASSEGAYELRFAGTFMDWRTGKTIDIQSDTLEMHTSDKMESELSLDLSPTHILYDPRYDNRLLYDYLIGLNMTDIEGLLDIEPGKQYIQTVNIRMTYGTEPIEDITSKGYSVQVTRKGSSGALVPGSSGSPELVSVSASSVVFDARQIDSNTYTISIMDDDDVVLSDDVVIRRETTMPGDLSSPRFAARILRQMEEYYNEANIITPEGNPIPYAELYYMIKWYTAHITNNNGIDSYDPAVLHMVGDTLDTQTKKIGLGSTEADSRFDVWFDMESHAAAKRITDESSNALTDGTNKLIATI